MDVCVGLTLKVWNLHSTSFKKLELKVESISTTSNPSFYGRSNLVAG